MNFESALKLLAEKRPLDFRFLDLGRELAEGEWRFEIRLSDTTIFTDKAMGRIYCTQDDLDEIAALLGWEYFVAAEFMLDVPTGESVFLGWQGYIFQKRQPPEDPTTDVFPTKIDAAKAALVAIIQEATK